jgi:hypothetical protein
MAGGGHGNFFWIGMFFPTFYGLMVFPVVGFIAADLKPGIYKVLFVLVMLFHYVGIPIQLFYTKGLISGTALAWAQEPKGVWFSAAVYLSTQAIIWTIFIRSLPVNKTTDDDLLKALE